MVTSSKIKMVVNFNNLEALKSNSKPFSAGTKVMLEKGDVYETQFTLFGTSEPSKYLIDGKEKTLNDKEVVQFVVKEDVEFEILEGTISMIETKELKQNEKGEINKLTKEDIITHVEEFKNLTKGKVRFIIGFGAALVLHGLRKETNDIDLIVTDKSGYDYLSQMSSVLMLNQVDNPTEEVIKHKNAKIGVFDIGFSGAGEIVYEKCEEVNNVIQTLGSILCYKTEWDRPKDQEDIRLIQYELFGRTFNLKQMKAASEKLNRQYDLYKAKYYEYVNREFDVSHLVNTDRLMELRKHIDFVREEYEDLCDEIECLENLISKLRKKETK